jgi:membrane-associated phospholipid phosphatase
MKVFFCLKGRSKSFFQSEILLKTSKIDHWLLIYLLDMKWISRCLLFIVYFFQFYSLMAQKVDSLKVKGDSDLILPSLMISSGFIVNGFHNNRPVKFSKPMPFYIDHFHYSIAAVGVLSPLLGGKSKHSFWDRSIYLFSGFAVSSAITLPLKEIMGVVRPDGSDTRSFPSGHATTAFAMAQWLREEYKQSHPILSLSGYLIAGTTAFTRVRYNKHWVADVIMGAGIGILSTKMVYRFFPNGFSKRDTPQSVLFPIYDSQSVGMGAQITF